MGRSPSQKSSKHSSPRCAPEDIALKTLFLGPQAENSAQVYELMSTILYRWIEYRRGQYPGDGTAISAADQSQPQFREAHSNLLFMVQSLMHEFEKEIPKFSPRYLGHMFSEVSLPALCAAWISAIHNPNNISAEASRVGLNVETSAIQSLSKMLGYSSKALGHFTSCGTIANLEAAFRALEQFTAFHQIHRNRAAFFFPKHVHYCWEKIIRLLGLKPSQIFWVSLDDSGRLDPASLKNQLQSSLARRLQPCFVLSVFGSTEFGICDPVNLVEKVIAPYRKKLPIWHHVDGAYGGFFASLQGKRRQSLNQKTWMSLRSLRAADSITIDPHKLGYVPYAAGCFICKNPQRYRMQISDSPYLHRDKKSSLLWTVEGSRSALGALGIYLTASSLPFNQTGFGRILARHLKARDSLLKALSKIPHLHVLPTLDLNILSFVIAKPSESASRVNNRSLLIYRKLSPLNDHPDFFVTKTLLDPERYSKLFSRFTRLWKCRVDAPLIVVRCCLMNPFFSSKEPKVDYIRSFAEKVSEFVQV